MKKSYHLLLCIFSIALLGCDKDDDNLAGPILSPSPSPGPTPVVDVTAPQIQVYDPTADDTFLSIGALSVYVYAIDNVAIKDPKVFLIDPTGARTPITGLYLNTFESSKERSLNGVIRVGGNLSGLYTILIEAEDLSQNKSQVTVPVNIIAEDLTSLDFKTAFMASGWFEQSDWNYGYLDLERFNLAFYWILNQNAWDYNIHTDYVDKFGEDFGQHKQLWSRWDANNNGYMENSEFEKGMADLQFFELWDANQDKMITEEEFADGVAKLWDVNKDNVVSANEFVDKLLEYFL